MFSYGTRSKPVKMASACFQRNPAVSVSRCLINAKNPNQAENHAQLLTQTIFPSISKSASIFLLHTLFNMEALAIRLCDVDVDDNENPILGLKKEPIVSFEEAVWHWQRLNRDVLDEDGVALAVDCAISAARKRKAMNPADPLTLDQIAAIHLYTQQSPIYSVLNAQLRNRDRNALKPVFPYLKLFLTALYSLPPVSSVTVYRGIKKDLSAMFRVGTEYQWWAFSSTAKKINLLENPEFLGTTGSRTMLHITATTAYDISKYSSFEDEKELILPPGSKLVVEGVFSPAEGLLMVQMRQMPYRPLFVCDGSPAASAVETSSMGNTVKITMTLMKK